MSPEEREAILESVKAIGSLTLGAILAVVITHRLTIARERANSMRARKREFLAFLEGWKYEIGIMRLVAGGWEGRNGVYGPVISTFIERAHALKWDFAKRHHGRFDALCEAITGNKCPTVYGPNDREKAIKSIQEIIDFVASHT